MTSTIRDTGAQVHPDMVLLAAVNKLRQERYAFQLVLLREIKSFEERTGVYVAEVRYAGAAGTAKLEGREAGNIGPQVFVSVPL